MSDREIRAASKAFEEEGTEEAEERLLRAVCRASGRQLVRTADPLQDTTGLMVKACHIEARRPGAWGELGGYVPRHGGDVWWIRHADMTAGAYSTLEFDEH